MIAAAISVDELRRRALPLCVRCRQCGKRAAVPAEKIGGSGDRQLAALPLKCSACGSRNVERSVPNNARDAFEFAKGID